MGSAGKCEMDFNPNNPINPINPINHGSDKSTWRGNKIGNKGR
jgi:hypothetical protein